MLSENEQIWRKSSPGLEFSPIFLLSIGKKKSKSKFVKKRRFIRFSSGLRVGGRVPCFVLRHRDFARHTEFFELAFKSDSEISVAIVFGIVDFRQIAFDQHVASVGIIAVEV